MDPITIFRNSFSFTIEPATASIHRLALDGRCAVYRIFSAYRNDRWATPRPLLELVEHHADRLVIRGDYATSGYGLVTTTTVTIGSDTLRVSYRAMVTQELTRNRLGLCVLLPATLACSTLTMTDTDGAVTEVVLPDAIAPHQPCTNIAALDFTPAIRPVTIRFDGDAFEMEDQRNWTDFSYKIYCTPLHHPRPVTLSAGTTVEQAVVIDFPSPPMSGSRVDAPVSLSAEPLKRSVSTLPSLGTRVVPAGDHPQGLPLNFLRLDLLPDSDPAHVESFFAQTGDLPVHLYEWRREGTVPTRRESLAADRVAFHTIADLSSARLTAPVGKAALGTPLVGTDGAFAQLNRTRPAVPVDGVVAFTVSPQVHDVDDEVVLHNLFGLRAVLASVSALYPHAPVAIGLMELTPHFDTAAGSYEENAAVRPEDSRMTGPFALAWAFAAYCEAAAAGVHSVCLFDATGPHGLLQDRRLVPAARIFSDLFHVRTLGGPFVITLPAAIIGTAMRYELRGPMFSVVADLDQSPASYGLHDLWEIGSSGAPTRRNDGRVQDRPPGSHPNTSRI